MPMGCDAGMGYGMPMGWVVGDEWGIFRTRQEIS